MHRCCYNFSTITVLNQVIEIWRGRENSLKQNIDDKTYVTRQWDETLMLVKKQTCNKIMVVNLFGLWVGEHEAREPVNKHITDISNDQTNLNIAS